MLIWAPHLLPAFVNERGILAHLLDILLSKQCILKVGVPEVSSCNKKLESSLCGLPIALAGQGLVLAHQYSFILK